MDDAPLALDDTITLRHSTQGRMQADVLLTRLGALSQDADHPALVGRRLRPWTLDSLDVLWQAANDSPLIVIHYSVVKVFAAGDWPSLEMQIPELIGRTNLIASGGREAGDTVPPVTGNRLGGGR